MTSSHHPTRSPLLLYMYMQQAKAYTFIRPHYFLFYLAHHFVCCMLVINMSYIFPAQSKKRKKNTDSLKVAHSIVDVSNLNNSNVYPPSSEIYIHIYLYKKKIFRFHGMWKRDWMACNESQWKSSRQRRLFAQMCSSHSGCCFCIIWQKLVYVKLKLSGLIAWRNIQLNRGERKQSGIILYICRER